MSAVDGFCFHQWKIHYDEYGVIYTGWFSAPFVLAWEEIQEVRRGKIDKSDFFLIVSEENSAESMMLGCVSGSKNFWKWFRFMHQIVRLMKK